MLCVITHILNDERYFSDSDHRKQVINVIKKLFHGLSEDEIAVIQDIFQTEFTEFDNKNGLVDGDEFIWKRKDIRDGNSNLWHQKYSIPCTEVLGFVACRVTLKVLGIFESERYWGDAKTIKSGKIYDIRCDISEKETIIFYTYDYIE